eukprot:scaffold89225_cov20-Tisochrysis_lutea.AAC.5
MHMYQWRSALDHRPTCTSTEGPRKEGRNISVVVAGASVLSVLFKFCFQHAIALLRAHSRQGLTSTKSTKSRGSLTVIISCWPLGGFLWANMPRYSSFSSCWCSKLSAEKLIWLPHPPLVTALSHLHDDLLCQNEGVHALVDLPVLKHDAQQVLQPAVLVQVLDAVEQLLDAACATVQHGQVVVAEVAFELGEIVEQAASELGVAEGRLL